MHKQAYQKWSQKILIIFILLLFLPYLRQLKHMAVYDKDQATFSFLDT